MMKKVAANAPPSSEIALMKGDAVLLVDVQNDFCPGGRLPIECGDEIISVLNTWIDAANRQHAPIYASRDWHPEHHVSFADRDGPWPVHCVQKTDGAAFHPELNLPSRAIVISKGIDVDRDAYSAFDGTGLADQLRSEGVQRLFVGGLALDVCVRATVLDALREGFEVVLIPGGSKPVDADAGRRTLQELQQAGATVGEVTV